VGWRWCVGKRTIPAHSVERPVTALASAGAAPVTSGACAEWQGRLFGRVSWQRGAWVYRMWVGGRGEWQSATDSWFM